MNLSDRQQIAALDQSDALASIEQLPLQIETAWKETAKIQLPGPYREVNQIVVCGMGASWLGAHIIQNLFLGTLKAPLVISHDYEIPDFVNEKTLVIASSYSGTTEETISGMQKAYEKKAKIITISTGGNLAEFANQNNLPAYIFNGKYNPAKSPRMGLGYSMAAQVSFLKQLGLINFDKQEIYLAVNHLNQRATGLSPETHNNEAMQLAQKCFGFMPIVVSGPFLLGNAHAMANQFNETAKAWATFMQIPELNHHNLEGLAHPDEVQKLKYLFLESNLYDPRIIKRTAVTKEVIEQNKLSYESYSPQGKTKIIQSFDCLLFGSYVTFYLAMLYGVDPTPNPYVDYFKKRLKEI